jgi:ribosomal protein L31E
MIPIVGYLTLVHSVLVAIPLHQLMVLSLKKKALKHAIKILRTLLWGVGGMGAT